MDARFQRLSNTDEFNSTSPPAQFPSNPDYVPQSQFADYDTRQMSYMSRKPVANFAKEPLIRTTSDVSSNSEPKHPVRWQTDQSLSSQNKRQSIWSRARGEHVSHIAAPLFAAPWRHEPCTDLGGARASTVREFDRRKQKRRIFFHFFLQWLLPVALCAALIVVLYAYSHKNFVTKQEKYMFNALVLGFGLFLGFVVVGGLKEYANIFRWRLLSTKYRSLQEFELVLGFASQRKALRLLWVGRTRGSILPNGTQLICFFYLVLMFGMQITIALLGLCYSVDQSGDWVETVPGNVSIADFQIINQGSETGNEYYVSSTLGQTGAANAYGISAQRYGIVYNPTEKDLVQYSGSSVFTDNQTSWYYQLVDSCGSSNCTSTTILSGRYAYSMATCEEFEVTSGGFIYNTTLYYKLPDGSETWFRYGDNGASGTTTWFSDMNSTCGARCTSTYVLNMGIDFEDTYWTPQFFVCNNTIPQIDNIGDVSNLTAYEMPDKQASILAGAIGWSGLSADNTTLQARTYDTTSEWSWTRLGGVDMNTTDIANLIMHFSIGAIASLDNSGPRLIVSGYEPIPAQSVSVEWPYAIAVLVIIPLVQFLILLVTVFFSNTAIVKDESYLSTARLLRPLVERLGKVGCMLTSDEICEVLGNPNLAYGVYMPHYNGYGGGYAGASPNLDVNDVMHVGVFPEEAERSTTVGMGAWKAGKPMPPGRYDGFKDEQEVKLVNGSDEGLQRRRPRRMSL